MKLKTIRNLNLKNKKVLLRVNFDLPIKNGKILDDSRILAHLPTIFYLIKKKAKVILISHLDDPQEVKSYKLRVKRYSLRPVAEYINNFQFPISNFQINSKVQIPKLKIKFIDGLIEPRVKEEIEKMKTGEVILLENLRFYKEEEENDKNFAKKLAELAEIYINDAFPVCHRKHSSVSAIVKYLPSYAGFLLEKEIKNLSQIFEKPKHPFVVVIGGAKISTKLPIIKNFLKIADKILVGGALANTFFAAKKLNISHSIYEPEILRKAKLMIQEKLVLPKDVKIKSKVKNQKSKVKNIEVNKLNNLKKESFKILDIGSETVRLFSEYLKSAKMIVFNGPMGYFEEKLFSQGTKKISQEILKNKKAKIFIGGGETITSVKLLIPLDQLPKNVFISTGGGAMLEFLSGKILPGIKPLFKNPKS